MTVLAANPLLNMDGVIKVDIVSQIVDPHPLQIFAFVQTRAHQGQRGRIGGNLGVTTHTGFGGRNVGGVARFNRGVTVAAIKAQPANMLGMAIGYCLGFGHTDFGHKG